VSDEVDGILRLARSLELESEHEPVNIGNPTEFTILECARKVIAATGSASPIKFEALPQDDPKQRRPNISKAQRLLGWEPKVELESGLKLSLEYFRRAVAEKEQRACR
jgi:dTDP-glucose 4,6-dehydratase